MSAFLLSVGAQQEEPTDPQPISNKDSNYNEALEGQLENFNASQKDAMKAFDMLEPAQKEELMKAIKSGDQKKVEQLMKEITLAATKNPEGIQKLVNYSLKQFREQSAPEVKAQLQEKIEGTIFKPIIEAVPRLLDFFVNLLRDPFALPEFFKIAANRTRLLIFLGVNILLFIIKWVIRKREKKVKAPLSERLSRFIFFSGLRFVLIGVFFHKELWPLIIVAKRTFS